jgi:hypothetical protein
VRDDEVYEHLADKAASEWVDQIGRLRIIAKYEGLIAPTREDIGAGAKELGLSDQMFKRLVKFRQSARVAGPRRDMRLGCSAINPAMDSLIRDTLLSGGGRGSLERTIRTVTEECLKLELTPPSSNAVRYRLRRCPHPEELNALIGPSIDLAIDDAELRVCVSDETGAPAMLHIIAAIEVTTGRIVAHSVHTRPPQSCDFARLALHASKGRSSPVRVAATTRGRAGLQLESEAVARGGMLLERKLRLRSGAALIATVGLRLGRIQVRPRQCGSRCSAQTPVPLRTARGVIEILVARHNAGRE